MQVDMHNFDLETCKLKSRILLIKIGIILILKGLSAAFSNFFTKTIILNIFESPLSRKFNFHENRLAPTYNVVYVQCTHVLKFAHNFYALNISAYAVFQVLLSVGMATIHGTCKWQKRPTDEQPEVVYGKIHALNSVSLFECYINQWQ